VIVKCYSNVNNSMIIGRFIQSVLNFRVAKKTHAALGPGLHLATLTGVKLNNN